MAQVTFRDGAGKRTKFFLTPDGRVDVDTVLLCFGASVVKLEEGDGSCSVLEKDRGTGLSRNVFKPGDLITIQLVCTGQGQGQGQAFGHAMPVPPVFRFEFETRQGGGTLDADSSVIMGGELLGEIDQALNVLPRNSTWSKVKTGEMEKGNDDPLYKLMGGPPDEMGIVEEGWDEPAEADGIDKLFSDCFSELPEGFRWLNDTERAGVRKVLAQVQVLVCNRNHAVLVNGSFGVKGALLGLGIYKRLTWTAVYRMHLEYFLWASVSDLPYVQLVTDMKTGGVMYYCGGKHGNRTALYRVVLRDMSQVKDLLATLCKSLMDFTPKDTLFHRFKF